MKFRNRGWIPVAWLASAVNFVAVWFAAVPGEPMHATLHAGLATGFGLGAMYLRHRRQARLQDQQLQEALDQNAYFESTAEALQVRTQELEERLDFAERLVANRRDGLPLMITTPQP